MKSFKFSVGITLSFALLLAPVSANGAAIKAGSPCSTFSQSKVVSGKKYTCIKSGKELVWSKGLPFKAAPKPAATPTPSSTVAPALPPLTYETLSTSRVPNEVRALIKQKILSAPATTLNLKVAIGPSLSASTVEPYLKGLQNVVNVFSPIYKPDAVYINYFSREDAGWVDQAITSAGGNANSTPNGVNYSQWMQSLPNCNMGNATIDRLGPLFNQCISPMAPRFTGIETSAHETFHTVQYLVAGNSLPVWFTEGGATFVGVYFGNYGNSDYANNRDATFGRYLAGAADAEFRAALKANDESVIVARLKAFEQSNAPQEIRNTAYVLGALAFEALVAVDGWEKYIQFHTQIKEQGFAAAFKSTYGITTDEFYLKLAPYVAAQI